MKNKKTIIIVIMIIISIIGVVITLSSSNKRKESENTLYSKQFGNVVLKFEKYDHALGQNMIVGVERSNDKGKTFERITENLITVSNEAKFSFINESIAVAISTKNISRNNNFMGFKISHDGGKTFQNASFNYENNRVDIITIEGVPYFDGDILKLKCFVYDIKADGSGYEDVEIILISNDYGLTWN